MRRSSYAPSRWTVGLLLGLICMFFASLIVLAVASDANANVQFGKIYCSAWNAGTRVRYRGNVVVRMTDNHGDTAKKQLPFFSGGDLSNRQYTYYGGDRIHGTAVIRAWTLGPKAYVMYVSPFCFLSAEDTELQGSSVVPVS